MKSIILRVLFIIAIIIIIVIMAFGIIRFIPMAFSSFANVGKSVTSPFNGDKVLVESSNSTIGDGDEFSIYWEYDADSDVQGEFFLNYPCVKDLKLNVVYPDENRRLLCNTNYPVSGDSIDLQAELDKEDYFADAVIEISFIEKSTENVEAMGSTVVTVSNSDAPFGSNAGNATIIGEPIEEETPRNIFAPATPATTATPNTGGTSVSVPVTYIPVDLAVSNAYAVDDLTVRFDIRNIGGQSTGLWYFSYATPDEDVEQSDPQPNLAPGQGIRYTLTLDESDSGIVAIAADSTNRIAEASELNNVGVININGGTNYSGNGNFSYNRNDDADLEIDEMEVGRMSGSRFVRDSNIDEDDDAAIRFVVVNRGGESTGSWRFEINDIPYDGNDDFRSSRQGSLRPGESIEIVVEFENPDEGRYDIEVTVDSDDDVDEEDERNNDESKRLTVDRR